MLAAVLLRGWRLSWRSTHYRDGSASSFVYTRRGPHTKGRFRHRFLAALAFRLASRRCPGHVRCGCGSRVRFAAARCRGYRRIIIAGDFLSAPPPDLVHSHRTSHPAPGYRVGESTTRRGRPGRPRPRPGLKIYYSAPGPRVEWRLATARFSSLIHAVSPVRRGVPVRRDPGRRAIPIPRDIPVSGSSHRDP